MEDEPDKYQSHFSEYIKHGIEASGIEERYKKGACFHSCGSNHKEVWEATTKEAQEVSKYIMIFLNPSWI